MDSKMLREKLDEHYAAKRENEERERKPREHISLLIKAKVVGIIPKPRGVFRKSCPLCNASLKLNGGNGIGGEYAYCFSCEQCDYEYISHWWYLAQDGS